MGIAIVIVLGLVAVTLAGIVGDGITRVAVARAKAGETAPGKAPAAEIESLTRRIGLLEARLDEKDDAQRKLQEELRFVTRMLEDRSGGKAEGEVSGR